MYKYTYLYSRNKYYIHMYNIKCGNFQYYDQVIILTPLKKSKTIDRNRCQLHFDVNVNPFIYYITKVPLALSVSIN